MATSTTLDVEFDDDIKDGGMDTLDFQDIVHDKADAGKTHEFTNFPHSAADSDDDADDKDQLLKDEKKAASFWTFAYYQQFFDVETHQVGKRILGSMLPHPRRNYLVKQIRPNPDLYGPFWICTTLVFTTAIAGNLANYFSAAGKDYHWQYDFHKVTIAATVIFSYWWLIPLALFGALWWRSSSTRSHDTNFTFLEIICVYGYSMAIFIPISILWVIQVSWIQWLLVIVGASLSGSVLLLTFWPAVSQQNKKLAVGLMVFIFVMHTALAAGFVLYFFHTPAPAAKMTPIVPSANTTVSIPLPKMPAGGDMNKGALVTKPKGNNPINLPQQPAGIKSNQANTANVVDVKKPIKPALPSMDGKREIPVTNNAPVNLKKTGSNDSSLNTQKTAKRTVRRQVQKA